MLAVIANVSQAVQPRPNTPAEMEWGAETGKLVLRYNGKVILDGTVSAENKNGEKIEAKIGLKQTRSGASPGDRIEQGLTFTVVRPPRDFAGLVLRGTVMVQRQLDRESHHQTFGHLD
jgi:hypothetical protein